MITIADSTFCAFEPWRDRVALVGRVEAQPGGGDGDDVGSAGGIVESASTSGARAVVGRVWGLFTTAVFVAAALAFLLLAVGPHVLGYRTATMLTGSMAPGINPGDVVVTAPRAASEVAVGDIITYEIPVDDHRVETHRVVKVTTDAAGHLSVVTKGDANSGIDPWVATIEGDTVWQTTAVVPHLGSAIRTLRDGLGQGYFLWTALGLLVLVGLRRIWSAPAGGDERG